MSVNGLRNRVDQLETSSGVNVPRHRVVLVPYGAHRDAAVAAADIRPGESVTVVSFVAPGEHV